MYGYIYTCIYISLSTCIIGPAAESRYVAGHTLCSAMGDNAYTSIYGYIYQYKYAYMKIDII